MKKLTVLTLSLLLVLGLCTAALAEDIMVTGTATVHLPADTANLELGASMKDKSAAEAQKKTDDIIKQVLTELEKLGIDKKDIVTSNYSVYVEIPYQEYGSIGVAPPVYNASSMLFITVRDLSQVAAIIDAATQAGANQINNLQFSASRAPEAYDKALTRAVEDAQHKAEVLAQAAGKKLGKLEKIQAEQAYGGLYGDGISNKMSFDAAQSGPSIVSGEVTVTANVTLTYEFE